MGNAATASIERGRRIAAHMLKVAPEDGRILQGRISRGRRGPRHRLVRGRARRAGAATISTTRCAGRSRPKPTSPFTDGGYPYGAAVCEVEIDPETGAVEIVRYCAIDDVGRAINPMILHGQTHGGIAQGVGQALWEQCVVDPEAGRSLTGSFMDYAMPRADTLPSFKTELMEVPSPTNPLGVRAGGEGGTTPALGAVINAVVDALREFGVTHIEMPATPERVWRAIRDAKARAAGPKWVEYDVMRRMGREKSAPP